MQFTQEDVSKLIQDVETEFGQFLAKSEVADLAAAPLAKAEDAKPEEKKKEEKPSEEKEAKPESKDEGKAEHKDEAPKAEAKPEHKEEEGDKKPEHSEKEGHAEEGKEADDEHHGYDEEDMEHMHKMYASMSKAERKAHHDAIMKCEGMAMSEKQEMPMQKSEDIQTAPEMDLMKSELDAEKAKSAALQKSLDGIQVFLTKLVRQVPQGKAITDLEVIAKSETAQESKQLSKSEIDSILAKKSADPTLKKSDREAINAFYLSNSNVNTISHLLK